MKQKILNITNGDSAVKIMQEANVVGDFLPWRDVLHDGPVPLELDFKELSNLRTEFIYEKGWGEKEFIQKSFDENIHTIKNISNYDKVILWFEHDLYDQLQILQILDLLVDKKDIDISMICTNNYLAQQTAVKIIELKQFEQKVTKEQFEVAKKAWKGFRQNAPLQLQKLLDKDISALPFLKDSIERLLQEYPSKNNGLPLSAKIAFEIINRGETNPWKIFELYQQNEESRFMGDYSFWDILSQYIVTSKPLLQTKYNKKLFPPFEKDESLILTPLGKEVLKSEKNWLNFGVIDRYIGGVHITNDNLWCFDNNLGKVIKK